MSTICYPLRWFARRVWPLCSTNYRLSFEFRVRNGDSCWLHTFSPRVPLHEHPLQVFSWFFVFVETFEDLSNSEVLRQHAGDV